MDEILAGKPGGSTPSQFAFPDSCKSMQELVNYRGMKHCVAGIFKACIPIAHDSVHSEDLLKIILEWCKLELEEPSTEAAGYGYGTEVIPNECHEIQDLIEYHNMSFSIGNIFKACYRMGHCEHSSTERDLNKCIWFATRELRRYECNRIEPH